MGGYLNENIPYSLDSTGHDDEAVLRWPAKSPDILLMTGIPPWPHVKDIANVCGTFERLQAVGTGEGISSTAFDNLGTLWIKELAL